MSFDEEQVDPHGECASEIARLRTELAAEREKFTMHIAHVGAWLSAVAQELGIAKEGDVVDVGTVCNAIMDQVKHSDLRRAALRGDEG